MYPQIHIGRNIYIKTHIQNKCHTTRFFHCAIARNPSRLQGRQFKYSSIERPKAADLRKITLEFLYM